MRVAVGQSPAPTTEYLSFAAQIGVSGIQLNTPDLPTTGGWPLPSLRSFVDQASDYGLVIEAIENFPNESVDKILLGLPGRDAQIEHVRTSIRNMGRARIPVLGMNWQAQSVWRTELGPFGRGASRVTKYDHGVASDPRLADEVWVARRDLQADAKDSWVRGSFIPLPVASISDEAMWHALEYFLDAVRDDLEASGVTLAIHPDDPPVEQLHGIPHILRSVDALERLVMIGDSARVKVDLCLGTVSEMGGEQAVVDAIRRLGAREAIAYVHLRDVRGTVPRFDEVFLGEGNYRPLRALSELQKVGFDGFILDDHTPGLVNDDAYGYRGRAHAIGYIQALLEVLQNGIETDT